MCGIGGLFDPGQTNNPNARSLAAAAMAKALAHRGPDGEGRFADADRGLDLVHRRLAVIDLSHQADQPMRSPNGRYMIIFNGEIYNYQEIARALNAERIFFDARSDTRVLLAAIEHWGLIGALDRTIGMFAFALCDLDQQLVHLVRDRLGVKPLSYGQIKGLWAFGSEVSALEAAHQVLGGTDLALDPQALSHYVTHGHVAEGTSIYAGFAKVPPGAIVSLSARGESAPEFYWRYEDVRTNAIPYTGTDQDACDELEAHLVRATGLRLVADVPVGIFLSGGIDSSLITALCAQLSARPGGRAPQSFTVGFDDMGLNEAPMARAVAHHVGIAHTEIMVDAKLALDVVPHLGRIFDEPFADASAIPTYLIAREARRHVTVALSGDGGDEGFGGYARHIMAARLQSRLDHVPAWAQWLMGASIDMLSIDLIDRLIQSTKGRINPALARRLNGGRIKGLARYLKSGQPAALYESLVRQWADAGDILQHPATCAPPIMPRADRLDTAMMAADMVGYLPGDVLVKVDRATMAHGLEAREPLLDHHLLAFAARLPPHLRIAGSKGKRALAEVLHRHVPQALVDRPKQGFSVPMDQWLRGPLRDWAQDLLAPARLDPMGLLNGPKLRALFAAHQSGRIDRQHQLWNALMLISWVQSHGH
jgi:asparagine synthase (glutamine-hydrolysing)